MKQSHAKVGDSPLIGAWRGRLIAMPGMDVLVVEDAAEYAQAISAILQQGGHRVRLATTIAAATAEFDAGTPDLVILDLTLPDGDGLDFCRQVRERSSAYVLMLTGRNDEVDKLVGFRLGADDYVTKPFSPRELAARIEALARRPRQPTSEPAKRVVGELSIHVSSREVTVGDSPVELTRIEFDLLEAFSSNPKLVFTRQQLLERVWGGNWFGDDHVVDVHVANLRKKLATAGAPNVVRTVRGVGYALGN